MPQPHHVVVIGGGFGGLAATRALRRAPVRVSLLDQRNFHLFQPLLYQVATGGLSPGDIATPLRHILKNQANAQALMARVINIDPARRTLILADGTMSYDSLIVAVGNQPNYFGHDDWRELAPGLKSIEDATSVRRNIFTAFERAEREKDSAQIRAHLTFVIVGGGATGVELAGAIAEIARDTLRREFRNINPADAQILLVDGSAHALSSYPADLSLSAERSLARLGVTFIPNTHVVAVNAKSVTLESVSTENVSPESVTGGVSIVPTYNVFWAAGVKAAPFAEILAENTQARTDLQGRISVGLDLSLSNHHEIFVIGDAAHVRGPAGEPLPGVAQYAVQGGEYAAGVIVARLKGNSVAPFRPRNYGSLAVIGRASAVADLGWIRLSGYFGWLFWLFLHIMKLVGFDNRVMVALQWGWNYFTFNRSARLITTEPLQAPVPPTQK